MTTLDQVKKKKQELASTYDPSSAFGSKRILDLMEEIKRDEEEAKKQRICPNCKGTGYVKNK